MKKCIFFTGILITTGLFSLTSQAQKPAIADKKTKEIIIRKSGDKTTKMTIEIDGDNVTVNGKPLADYHGDDVSVIKRDFMRDKSRNFLWAPENDEDMELNVFDNDNDNHSERSRTFLGVMTEKSPDGVKITSVVKGSAAEKSGLQKDDIITQINDKKITSPDNLMDVVKSYKPDDNVKIDFLRDNKKKDIKVKLGETKDKSNAFFYKYNNPNMNGDAFNFKMSPMPPMPPMTNLPKAYYNYKYKLGNGNNPKLGVKIEDTENESGAKILSVEDGSAADKAGLKKDDIITEINGEKVSNVDEAREQLNEREDGDNLKLKAKRNSTEMSFEVKIPKQLNSADL